MAKPLKVDLANLTKPISDLQPAGESLRRSVTYDRIKEARREDDPNLAQGIWKTTLKRADWGEVHKLSVEALTTRSKDLRICGWLTEAWLVLHGPEGAEQGLRLMETFVTRYWDTVYPSIGEDGDLDGRLAPIGWVNDKLAMRLKTIQLTDPSTPEPQVFTWNDWERATLLERSNRKAGEGEISTAQFMTSVLLTPASFYRELEKGLSLLVLAITDFEDALDKRCGEPMAALWQFKETLGEIRKFGQKALSEKSEDEIPGDETSPEDGAEGLSPEQAVNVVQQGGARWGAIRNRAEAYQRLSQAADFLMRTEPHSPTPHLIRRAVSWGNMSFTDLIAELVRERSDLQQIFSLLGIDNDS